jgi:hypothetical protein
MTTTMIPATEVVAGDTIRATRPGRAYTVVAVLPGTTRYAGQLRVRNSEGRESVVAFTADQKFVKEA